MNKMNKFALALGALLAAGGAVAESMNSVAADPGYALYRRAVLGDNIVVPESTATTRDGGQVLGSYALYLLRNGASKSEALAKAQAIGEFPHFDSDQPKVAAAKLSPYDLYRRAVLKTSDAELAPGRHAASRRETQAQAGFDHSVEL